MSKKKTELTSADISADMLDAIQRAQSGDETAIPIVRDILDQVPSMRELMGAELDRIIQDTISKSLGGKENLAFQEAMKRKLASLREELEGPSPTMTERLLVDRVVACWLQVQEADLRYVYAGECSIPQANYHLKRQDRAHRRFLTAMKTLATVRKMALPVLQVNIGENQVNMASVAEVSPHETIANAD